MPMTDPDDYAQRCVDIAHAINFVEARLDGAPDATQIVGALRQLAHDYEAHYTGRAAGDFDQADFDRFLADPRNHPLMAVLMRRLDET
jgi:hypothetical protein